MLGLFVNTLAADHKYSLLNCDKLMEPIQMQLFITKTFSLFFTYWKLNKFLNILKKKGYPYSLCFCEITGCERRGWANV